jgi:hypothetical protein
VLPGYFMRKNINFITVKVLNSMVGKIRAVELDGVVAK